MPLVDAEVGVEVVGDRVPRDLPAHPRLQRSMSACGARETYTSVVSRAFRCARWRDLVGHERAAAAAALGPAGHAGLEEEAVDDQLTAPLEQVEQAHRAVRALEGVVLLHGHPRHPAALGGQRVAGAGQLLLLDQQLLAGGVPLLRRRRSAACSWRCFLLQVLVDDIEQAPPEGALAIHPVGGDARAPRARARADASGPRPRASRRRSPRAPSGAWRSRASTRRSRAVASPTVAGPAARRSTMPRRIGCDSALNGSFTMW